ncbi:uncharacterized protein LOC133476374 isoform X4 [Phyllopteryx taeniolatus]|uniref:uncharacterized protein LOC133476374 isoform X4 n=1 Tax=Phyllopteryx taeniolatus TaxID=161469 RepID=UPI002AD3D29C|nr:uncharacterized protein LOC133476374 isoform X4 [Phyllopteryx taeniolatus]
MQLLHSLDVWECLQDESSQPQKKTWETCSPTSAQTTVCSFKDSGSSFIVTPSGLIITNAHVITTSAVVMGRLQLQVQLHDGSVYEAVVREVDRKADIATIKVNSQCLLKVSLYVSGRSSLSWLWAVQLISDQESLWWLLVAPLPCRTQSPLASSAQHRETARSWASMTLTSTTSRLMR